MHWFTFRSLENGSLVIIFEGIFFCCCFSSEMHRVRVCVSVSVSVCLCVRVCACVCVSVRVRACVCITRYFMLKCDVSSVHETYTVNVCFWRLGWLSDIRVSNKMISLKVT